MDLEKVGGLVALGWLIGAFLLMVRSTRSGQELADALAERHPEIYKELGNPRPGILQSARRDRFSRFVARREFENLGDPVLSARFEQYRRAEARLVVSLIATMLIVACLMFVIRDGA